MLSDYDLLFVHEECSCSASSGLGYAGLVDLFQCSNMERYFLPRLRGQNLNRIHRVRRTELLAELTDYFSDQPGEKADPDVFLQALN